jgi:hypothetical protein
MNDSEAVTVVDAQALVLGFAGQLSEKRGCILLHLATQPFAVRIHRLGKQDFELLAQFFPGTLALEIGIGKFRDCAATRVICSLMVAKRLIGLVIPFCKRPMSVTVFFILRIQFATSASSSPFVLLPDVGELVFFSSFPDFQIINGIHALPANVRVTRALTLPKRGNTCIQALMERF